MGESWLIETQFLAVIVQFDILLLITYLEPYPRLETHSYLKKKKKEKRGKYHPQTQTTQNLVEGRYKKP